jgi:arylsulfatase
VLFSVGGNDRGLCDYVLDGVFTYGYNYVADSFFYVRANGPLAPGHHVLSMELAHRPGRPGRRQGHAGPRHPFGTERGGRRRPAGDDPLSLGLRPGWRWADPGSPALPDYKPPFAYPGRILLGPGGW